MQSITKKETIYLRFLKPFLGRFVAWLVLITFFWLFLLIAIVIKAESPGPVFFKQKRIWKNKKDGSIQFFYIWKFRTMRVDTPHDVPTHLMKDPEQWITRIGKILRKYSLDELPQFLNCAIFGNLVLVGPRPALWNQDDLYQEREKYRANDLVPGITGLAQVSGRDELPISVKARIDGKYANIVQKSSLHGLLMDCYCLCKTVTSVLRSEGVVEGGTGADNLKKKKRIAVLSSHTPSLFWFRMDMMKSFIQLGYEVYALGNEAESLWKDKFIEQGIQYFCINVERNGTNPIRDIETLFSVKKCLKKIKPEKVFTYQAKTIIYGTIAANLIGITEVYPLIAGMGSAFMAKGLKARLVKAILKMEYRISLRKCPAVFFQNMDDVELYRKERMVTGQNIVMLHGSGVNTDYFSVQSFPKEFGFICISRLIRDKGVFEYLEACRKVKYEFPEVRCILVGPFDSNPTAIKQEELQKYINGKVIEYFGEQEDVRPYLGMANVFVLPSYREGTPKTVLEAMSTGRAIITTDAPGCRETVQEGENGFLVRTKDIDSLYDRMVFLIEHPDTVKEMGKKGRLMAEKVFNVKLVNKTICNTMQL